VSSDAPPMMASAPDGLDRLTGRSPQHTYDHRRQRLTRLESRSRRRSVDRSDELINQVISGTTKTFGFDAFGKPDTAADANLLLTTYTYDEPAVTTIAPHRARVRRSYPMRSIARNPDRPPPLTHRVSRSRRRARDGNAATDALSMLRARGSRSRRLDLSFPCFDLHGSLSPCALQAPARTPTPNRSTAGPDPRRHGPRREPVAPGASDVSRARPRCIDGRRLYSPQLGVHVRGLGRRQGADPLSMNRFVYRGGPNHPHRSEAFRKQPVSYDETTSGTVTSPTDDDRIEVATSIASARIDTNHDGTQVRAAPSRIPDGLFFGQRFSIRGTNVEGATRPGLSGAQRTYVLRQGRDSLDEALRDSSGSHSDGPSSLD